MGADAIDVRAFINTYAERLTEHLRVDRILLFGSYADGTATPDSDLDLLIVSPDFGDDYVRNVVLLQKCLPPRDRPIDVDTLARTPAEVASAEPDTFLAAVLADAVVVFEAPAPAGPS